MPFPKTPSPVPTTDTQPSSEASLAASYERREEMLREMAAEDVVLPHAVDVHDAIAIVNGSLGPVAALRDEIIEECGEPARTVLDELPGATEAARHALVLSTEADAVKNLSANEADLRKEHATLLADADAFGARGLIDPKRIDHGRPVQGYRTLINSTLFLAHLLREHSAVIDGKTPLTKADLDRAEQKARVFGDLVDAREAGAAQRTGLDMRNRAVAHAVRTYDQVRRYLTFVRWSKGDADTIAPSLYSGRRRPRGSEPVVVDAPTPVLPVPMEPMPGVPNNGGGPFQE